jgi:MFS family permease
MHCKFKVSKATQLLLNCSIEADLNRTRTSELFLNIGHTLDHLFLLIYPTVVLVMAPEFGRSYGEMLPLALGGFIAFGAGSLPAGWLADRWSRRGMMIVFFTGIGVTSILTGFATTPSHIAIGLTLIGVFGAIYHPVGLAMLVAGRDKVGRLLGVNGVYGNLGVAFASLVAGALAHWISWRAAFIIPGAVSVGIGIAFAVLVPETRIAEKRTGSGTRTGTSRSFLIHAFAILTVTTICGGLINNSTTIAMPKLFAERLNALVETTLGIGILLSLVYAFASFAQLVVGYFLDRSSIKPVLLTVVGLQIPLLFAGAFFENHLMLAVALVMMFFVFGQIPINDAMVAAYADETWRSRVFALRYVVSFGASALAVPLVAWMHGATGEFKHLFFVLSTISAVMFMAAISMPTRAPQPAPV